MTYGTKIGVSSIHCMSSDEQEVDSFSHECYLALFSLPNFAVTRNCVLLVCFKSIRTYEMNKTNTLMHTSDDGSGFTGTGYLGSQLTCYITGLWNM